MCIRDRYVVYLKASAETIYERVKEDTKRPLLQCEDPLSRIRNMLEQRREAYESTAHYIVRVDTYKPVSYTHLDVYKRQLLRISAWMSFISW